MIFYSAEINGIHMMKRYQMALRNMHCAQPPEPFRNLIELKGANGVVDLSEYQTGYPLYKNRLITMEFGTGFPELQWPSVYSELMTNFHNQKVTVIFDDDRGYYYSGRAKVSNYERSRSLGIITIEVDADPYKYELHSALDDWEWDLLDLENGVVREYGNISVNGEETVRIIGSEMPVIPVVIVDTAMSVTIRGKTYQLKPGKNKIYDVVLMREEYWFRFSGNGIVSVEYRGGKL